VLLLALCFAEAGSHFDEPGAAYIYTREAFGEFAGFQVGWMTWLARLASAAALWNGFVQALTFVLPEAAEGTRATRRWKLPASPKRRAVRSRCAGRGRRNSHGRTFAPRR
jgi:amino acid transporter